ncbi:MAG TPA: Mur ligase family protein, partial [Thermoanaerobaculia bacterium]|nr:Mur ligase family protein [Thermoanaerobaculia bacterium]
MALPSETVAALERLARFGTRLGLERMRRLLAALGDPQDGLPAVLVAGTNGKGTVSALLASFGAAGRYKTGLYTSPHLETWEERLRIGGAAIEGEALGALLDRVLAAAGEAPGGPGEPPTLFEALTAAALLWFAEKGVELAVLEVGLGGRFDAPTAVEPRLAVVTSVGLDHREHLGETLAEVAREKAGILRAGVPAVTAAGPEEVEAVLAAEAERLGAPRVRVPERLAVEAVQRFKAFSDPPELRQRVWLGPPARVGGEEAGAEGERHLEVFELALAGRHQAQNLAVALVAAAELRAAGWERLTERALKAGAKACRWPGRLEEVALPPGPGSSGAGSGPGGRVLLDVAHNPGGAAALAAALDDLGEPVDLLFGALEDKDAAAMLAELAPRASGITLTRPSGDRGREAATLRDLLPPDQ